MGSRGSGEIFCAQKSLLTVFENYPKSAFWPILLQKSPNSKMRLFLVISQPFLGGLHFLQGICMHPEENWCKGGWHHTISKLNILSKKKIFTFWVH